MWTFLCRPSNHVHILCRPSNHVDIFDLGSARGGAGAEGALCITDRMPGAFMLPDFFMSCGTQKMNGHRVGHDVQNRGSAWTCMRVATSTLGKNRDPVPL